MQDTQIDPASILRQLQWRYATKQFDPVRKIPQEQWEVLEQALLFSPSSYGLQPWKFLVIDDPAARAKLQSVSWGQSQIVTASHLVVFAQRKDFSPADVDRFIRRVAEVRGVAPESLEQYRRMMTGSINSAIEKGSINIWTSRQVYIALGTLLTTAAMMGIDACPMEGIEAAKYDEVLGLTEQGFGALCVATLGYRAADDHYARLAKVRYPITEVIQHI